jgi:siroheme synthase
MGLRQRKSRNGTIDTIQETVAVNKLSSPAIIVIGKSSGTVREEQVL